MNLFRKHKKFEDQLKEQLGDAEYKPSESLWDRIDSGIAEDGFETGVQQSLENFEQVPYPETWEKIAAELPEEQVAGNKFLKYYGFGLLALLFSTAIYLGYKWNEQPDMIVADKTMSIAEDKDQPAISSETSPADAVQSDGHTTAVQPKEIAPVKKAESDNNNIVNQPVKEQEHTINRAAEKGAGISDPIVPIAASTNNSSVTKQTAVVVKKDFSAVKPDLSKNTDKQMTVVKSPKPLQQAATSDNKGAADHVTSQATVAEIDRGNNSSETLSISSQGNAPAVVQTQSSPLVTASEPQVKKEGSAAGESKQPVTENKQSEQLPPVMPAVVPVQENVRVLTEAKPDTAADYKPPVDINEEELTRISISVLTGAQLCFTTYKQPSNSSLDFSRNIALRKKLERPAIDWSGAFLIDVRLNHKWMLSSGIMMTNFTQKFDYNTLPASSPANPNETGAGVRNPNDSVVSGNVYSNRIKYSWTEIPVLINYKVADGRRINLDLQGGVSYAIINTVDAGIISYDNKGVLMLKDKEAFPQIKNTVFVSLMPQVSYQFNQLVSLGLIPSFKYSLTSMIGNEKWVQQHPYFLGLNLCLRKRF